MPTPVSIPPSTTPAPAPTAAPNPWYRIQAPQARPASARTSVEILIYGTIGDGWDEESVTAAAFVRDLAAIEADEIIVRINSFGGSVADALAIYNALCRHPAAIITINDGIAMSAASLILMAGDEVQVAANSIIMIHAPWNYVAGNSAELRRQAEVLDRWAVSMSVPYMRSHLTSTEVMALLTDGSDHYYNADEAIVAGFADRLSDAPADETQMRAQLNAAIARYPSLATQLEKFMPTPAAAPNPHPAPSATPSPAAPAPIPPAPAAAPTAPAPAPADPAAILAADQTRRAAIRAQFANLPQGFDCGSLAQTCEDDPGCTAEAAASRILAHLGRDAGPVGGPRIETVEDETDKRRDAVAVALLTRAGLANDEQRRAAQASEFRNMSLLDLARDALARAGINSRNMDRMQIVASGFTQSTSDFPVLLENAMHRALLGAYQTVPDTWTRFCARGTVSDFRPHTRIRQGSFGNLDVVNEVGEFKNKAIPDGEKSQVRISTKGNIINLSRQMIINDDLGAFLGLAAQLGRVAHRSIEADVYAALLENNGLGPRLADGKTLFHTDHKNIGTAAAISVNALDDDRVLMAAQQDISGNEFLDIRPAVLLVPLALGGETRVIVNAEYDPDTAGKLHRPNKVRDLVKDIVDTPRISGTRRYLLADPLVAPVLEVAFLDGQDEPFLERENGFDVDGARLKVRLDYGVNAVDFRGAVTNAGA